MIHISWQLYKIVFDLNKEIDNSIRTYKESTSLDWCHNPRFGFGTLQFPQSLKNWAFLPRFFLGADIVLSLGLLHGLEEKITTLNRSQEVNISTPSSKPSKNGGRSIGKTGRPALHFCWPQEGPAVMLRLYAKKVLGLNHWIRLARIFETFPLHICKLELAYNHD